jgi:hypothetical protein
MRRLDRKLDRQRRANNPANYDERGRVKRGPKRWKASKRQPKVQARRRELYRRLAATRTRSHGHLAHRVLALGTAFHLEQLSYRAWQRTDGKSVQLCAPGLFVEWLSRVPLECWRDRCSDQHLESTVISNVLLRPDHEESPLTALAGLPLRHERAAEISSRRIWRASWIPRRPCRVLGQAQAAWPGWERTRHSAYEQAISNQPGMWQASACRLWSASGRPEGDAGRLHKDRAVCPEGAEE